MPQRNETGRVVRISLSGWKAALVGLALLAVAAVVAALFALGFVLFALPVLLVAPVIYFLAPKARPSAGNQPARKSTIIDAQYRVIDDGSERGKDANS